MFLRKFILGSLGLIFISGWIVGVEGLNNISKAAETCNYTVSFGLNKRSVSYNETITATAVFRRSALAPVCVDEMRVSLLSQSNPQSASGGLGVPAFEGAYKTVRFVGDSATATYNFTPSNINSASRFSSNELRLYASSTIRTGTFTNQTLKSSIETVTVSGLSSSTGNVTGQIVFSPQQSEYAKEDLVEISFKPSIGSTNTAFANQYNNLISQGVNQIYFVLKVNDDKIDDFTKDTSRVKDEAAFGSFPTFHFVRIKGSNHFKNGANQVSIELWQKGTTLKVASATASLNATGLAETETPGSDPCSQISTWPAEVSEAKPESANHVNCVKSLVNKLDTAGAGGLPLDGQFDTTLTLIIKTFQQQKSLPVTGKVDPATYAALKAAAASGEKPPPDTKPPGGNDIIGSIQSPIAIGNIGELIITLMKYLLGLVAALAVLFIIIGGVRMVASGGSETSVTAGKKTVTWAVIGLVVSLLAFTIVNLVQSLLKVTN